MTITKNMSQVTRGLVDYQQQYAEEISKDKTALGFVKTGVVTVGAMCFVHAEIARRVANLFVLTILYLAARSDVKALTQQRVECSVAFTMWIAYLTALLKMNLLIRPIIEQKPMNPEKSAAEAPIQKPAPAPRASSPQPAEPQKARPIIEAIRTPPPSPRTPSPRRDEPQSARPSAETPSPSPRTDSPQMAKSQADQLTPPPSPESSPIEPVVPRKAWKFVNHAPAAAAPHRSYWPWNWGNAAAAGIEEVEEEASPVDSEEPVRHRLQGENILVKKQFEGEQPRPFSLVMGSLTTCIPSRRVVGEFEIGICQLSTLSTKTFSTQLTTQFELVTERKTYDVFVAANIEAIGGERAARYLKNHLTYKLISSLHRNNLDELSLAGITNALDSTFKGLRALFESDFKGMTDHLDDLAFATVVMVLDGAVWTANLGMGSAILLNHRDEKSTQQLAFLNEIKNPPQFFGIQSSAVPRITITPIQEASHLVLGSSDLIRLGSIGGIANAVRRNIEQPIETLAYSLACTANLRARGDFSCMIIAIPENLGATSGSGLHLDAVSQASSREPSEDDLVHTAESSPPVPAATAAFPGEALDIDGIMNEFATEPEMEQILRNGQPPKAASPATETEAPPATVFLSPTARTIPSPISPQEPNSPPVQPTSAREDGLLSKIRSDMVKTPSSPERCDGSPVLVEEERLSEGYVDVDEEVPARKSPAAVKVEEEGFSDGSDFDEKPPIISLANVFRGH